MTDAPAARDALLERMDAAWAGFGGAVDQLDGAALAAPTPSGWTLAAMLAHVTGWHEATAFRVHRFGATGHSQPKVEEDDDRFNARVAAETADLPPDRILVSLRASYGRLRDAVASLDGLDDDGWVEHVVAGNTYEHYEEHLPEVQAALR
ncbi:MAG TPA: maleylpyruvate isomerase N-terminal domain-containing protein [Candidatus Limnocylindrales bacterium]|nr:maleylpyruvate isomerase N-terminal domain-containing protein [Candidatus Limnocylindrales bacterium]